MKENKITSHIILLGIIILGYLIVSVWGYRYVAKNVQTITTGGTEKVQSLGELKKGDVLVQKVKYTGKRIDKIGVFGTTYKAEPAGEGKVCLSLLDDKTGKEICSIEKDMNELWKESYAYFVPEEVIEIKKNTELRIELEVTECSDSTSYAVWLGEEAENSERNVVYNGKLQNGTLMLSFEGYRADYLQKIYVLLAILLGFLIVFAYWMLFIKKGVKVEFIYLVFAGVLGIMYLGLIPESETPDEEHHFWSAYSVSNILLGYDSDNIEMRKSDLDSKYIKNVFERKDYNEYIKQLLYPDKLDSEIVSSGYEAINTVKYQYFVPGSGIAVARLLKLGTVRTYLIGSIFNFIFFLLCTFYAIRKIPCGKEALMMIALLPITMQQATSYSYDCFVIALSFILVALSIKAIVEGVLSNKEIIILALVTILFAPVKSYAYIALCALILVPIWKYRRTNKRLVYSLAIILVICLSVVGIRILLASPNTAEQTEHLVGMSHEQGYTLHYLLNNKESIFEIVGNTIFHRVDFYLLSMLGYTLGCFTIPIPSYVVLFLGLLLFIAIIKNDTDKDCFSWKIKSYFLIIVAICIACIEGGMLLGWTTRYVACIDGVQGRYFIPVLLLALLTLRGKWCCKSEKVNTIAIYLTLLTQPFILISLVDALK